MDELDDRCLSPSSCVDSVLEDPFDQYSTPATSPASSPCRPAKPRDGCPRIDEVLQDDDEAGHLSEHVPDDDRADLHVPPPYTEPSTPVPSRAAVAPRHSTPQRRSRLLFSAKSNRARHRHAPFCVEYADRFVPGRSATPTKQALLLSKAPAPARGVNTLIQAGNNADPFMPARRQSMRIAEQYAVTRTASRSVGPQTTAATRLSNLRNAQFPHNSDLTVTWSSNGHPVTEGVASITDSRGGRLTSGSSAPHFCADLLRMTEKDTGGELHQRRLAVAMDIEQDTEMISPPKRVRGGNDCLTPTLDATPVTIWKDSRWQSGNVNSRRILRDSQASKIPTVPYRVLDAPTLRDDFYCSLLAYDSVLDCLAVGLGSHVYVWSEKGRRSPLLPESLVSTITNSHITSLSFSSSHAGKSILAIGRSDGVLSLWNPMESHPRFSNKHTVPISFVSFRPSTARRPSRRDSQIMVNTEELLIGDDLRQVVLYSVEWPSTNERDLFDWTSSLTIRAVMTCHTQQVCGIAWSIDGSQFATGGNDNRLFVFDHDKIDRSKPDHTWSAAMPSGRLHNGEHLIIAPGGEKQIFALNAAVKAIAFAPWQSDLLAAGGGSNDRCVHFFHVRSGARLATINCHAQVTSITWNTQRRELAVTLGFAQPKHSFRVAVFAWPSCALLASIPWAGEERALYAVQFPGGPHGRRDARRQTLVIATSDASIKFHEVWPKRQVRGQGEGTESQILNDTCSEELQAQGMIR